MSPGNPFASRTVVMWEAARHVDQRAGRPYASGQGGPCKSGTGRAGCDADASTTHRVAMSQPMGECRTCHSRLRSRRRENALCSGSQARFAGRSAVDRATMSTLTTHAMAA